MRRGLAILRMAAAGLLGLASAIHAQSFNSVPGFPLETTGPVIHAHAEALKPFTVAGERGVLLGQQDGTFEAWALPVKLLSHLTIEANVEGYSVPIDVNQQAAEIEVRPERTVITYSHVAFTVRQIMFSPNEAAAGTGPMVLFEFDCLKPTDFVFRFTPELKWMWPERNEGEPGVEWIPGMADGKVAAVAGGGFYVLHSDYPDLAGAVTIPGAEPGILAPYQERPQGHPVELKLHIDPARDRGRLFPLLMAVGMDRAAAATSEALAATLAHLERRGSRPATRRMRSGGRSCWLRRLRLRLRTKSSMRRSSGLWCQSSNCGLECIHDGRTGAGGRVLCVGRFGAAGIWVVLWARLALYALCGEWLRRFCDWPKSELEFLIHRQRADGKIMHEYSQTAADVDWQAFPYMYAAADSTPLFLLAVRDYVRASGDAGFLTANRAAIEKAWAFETDPAHDTDHDGIYDNSQGTGWVESWPGAMPHQEIYLALLDQQASAAMAGLEKLLGSADKRRLRRNRRAADTVAKTIEARVLRRGESRATRSAAMRKGRWTMRARCIRHWPGGTRRVESRCWRMVTDVWSSLRRIRWPRTGGSGMCRRTRSFMTA